MKPVVENDKLRTEHINRRKAEELYRQIDSNERIKKSLSQRTYGYGDSKEGDMVLFKEKGKHRWSGPANSEKMHMGVWFLQNKETDENMDNESRHDVFAVEIPKQFHDCPEVKEAKDSELRKWEQYEAFEQVSYVGQPVISMRWVVTEKDDGKVKATLVVKGLEKQNAPQSDSRTASKESSKLFLSLCVNEGLRIKTLDVTSAFLQGQPLTRDVYDQPPSELSKEGFVWELKKTCY